MTHVTLFPLLGSADLPRQVQEISHREYRGGGEPGGDVDVGERRLYQVRSWTLLSRCRTLLSRGPDPQIPGF